MNMDYSAWDLALKIGTGVIIFLFARSLLNIMVKRAKNRQIFMKEYLTVLNSPAYKIKRKST